MPEAIQYQYRDESDGVSGAYSNVARRLDSQVPPNIMFPDLFDDVMSRSTGGRDRIGYNLKLGMPIQQADQKWLDGIMSYLEYARSHPDLNWEP